MGVTRENRDLFIYEFVEDDLELLEQHADDESSTELPPQSSRRNANRNRTRGRSGQILDNQCLNRRKMGAKQARRTENFRQLLTLAEKDELGELQLDNVFEPSSSAFEKLFSEREKMKIWNDFVNRSEEEQETILHPSRSQNKKTESADENLDDSWEEIPDKRTAHPAFTAEECYRKVDRKLKDLLKRRQLPMVTMRMVKEEHKLKTSTTHSFLHPLYSASTYRNIVQLKLAQICCTRAMLGNLRPQTSIVASGSAKICP